MKLRLSLPCRIALALAAAVPAAALAQHYYGPHGGRFYGAPHYYYGGRYWYGPAPRFYGPGWGGGRWYHGWYGGRPGWWWIVGGNWYLYPAPVYPYPDPYALPVTVLPAPPAVTGPAPQQSWYWCANPAGYYPTVPQCSVPWQPVAAGNSAAAQGPQPDPGAQPPQAPPADQAQPAPPADQQPAYPQPAYPQQSYPQPAYPQAPEPQAPAYPPAPQDPAQPPTVQGPPPAP